MIFHKSPFFHHEEHEGKEDYKTIRLITAVLF